MGYLEPAALKTHGEKGVLPTVTPDHAYLFEGLVGEGTFSPPAPVLLSIGPEQKSARVTLSHCSWRSVLYYMPVCDIRVAIACGIRG